MDRRDIARIEKKGDIAQNIVLFCRILRRLKMDVTMGRVLDGFRSLKHIHIRSRSDLYYTLRRIFFLG